MMYRAKEWYVKSYCVDKDDFRIFKINRILEIQMISEEFVPMEYPQSTDNYLYIYCLWVAGSFKGKEYAKSLIEYCINDAKEKEKSGVCILSSKKKKPFLADKKFLLKYGFEVVDTVKNEYELLVLSFNGEKPYFSESVKEMRISGQELTIYRNNKALSCRHQQRRT